MATLTLTFDTGSVPLTKIHDAFASAYNYQATKPNPSNPGQTIPNPENKTDFTRRMVKQYIEDVVKSQDFKSARANAEANVSPITLK